MSRQRPLIHMTPIERTEWNYRRDERLGFLTEGKRPAGLRDYEIAEAEAHAWLAQQHGELPLR